MKLHNLSSINVDYNLEICREEGIWQTFTGKIP